MCSLCYCDVSLGVSKKQAKLFCCNLVKFPPTLIIFGTKMANSLKLYEVHSFSILPNGVLSGLQILVSFLCNFLVRITFLPALLLLFLNST